MNIVVIVMVVVVVGVVVLVFVVVVAAAAATNVIPVLAGAAALVAVAVARAFADTFVLLLIRQGNRQLESEFFVPKMPDQPAVAWLHGGQAPSRKAHFQSWSVCVIHSFGLQRPAKSVRITVARDQG